MTIRELKERLDEFPETMDTMDVWLSTDPEGNDFSPLSLAEIEYVALDEYQIIFHKDLQLYSEDEYKQAMVLWP